MKLWPHQQKTYDFALKTGSVMDTSSPGTGKTAAWARVIENRFKNYDISRALIVCPKTIMHSAWGKDLERFAPNLTCEYALAPATVREAAFESLSDVVILNVDGMKWLKEKGMRWVKRCMGSDPMIVIDESQSIRNPQAQRTKATMWLHDRFKYATCMSGTPAPNSVTELWSQVYMLDGGQRLGKRFTAFRNTMQRRVPIGGMFHKWVDIPQASEVTYALIQDLTIGHKFDDVMTHVPDMAHYVVPYTLSPAQYKAYFELRKKTFLEIGNSVVTAVNAAVLANKLLQISSGAVYSETGEYTVVDEGRYDLITDLIDAREKTVLFCMWKHQHALMMKKLAKAGLQPLQLSSEMTSSKRAAAVEKFQNDPQYRAILMHPKTGAFGLTLTAATTTIFASPVYDAAAYVQGAARIRRGEQARPTECIVVCAGGTQDRNAYDVFTGKKQKLDTLNDLLQVCA